MDSSLKYSFVISCLVLIVMLASPVSSTHDPFEESKRHGRWSEYEVILRNKMSYPVTVQCKSKDNDLGVHVLKLKEEFNWWFKVNFLGTTLYWCTLDTILQGNKRMFVKFEAFWPEKSEWLASRCGWAHCIWTFDEKGVYIINRNKGTEEFIHPWKPFV